MQLTLLKAKIHRAVVTETDVNYNGSISIDKDLLEESGIIEHERVEIYNITNGVRFATYAIPADRGSKKIGINGAAARMVQKGDLVIICAYIGMEQKEALDFKPKVVIVDSNNNITTP